MKKESVSVLKMDEYILNVSRINVLNGSHRVPKLFLCPHHYEIRNVLYPKISEEMMLHFYSPEKIWFKDCCYNPRVNYYSNRNPDCHGVIIPHRRRNNPDLHVMECMNIIVTMFEIFLKNNVPFSVLNILLENYTIVEDIVIRNDNWHTSVGCIITMRTFPFITDELRGLDVQKYVDSGKFEYATGSLDTKWIKLVKKHVNN